MIRVLCVDDNPHDRALIRDALEREADSFAMIEASDRKAFEKALVKGGFDVVLTDFNILGFEGLEVVQKVKERFPDIPVIVVTGTGSEEVAVAALKQGADDYVIKSPRHIARLPFTIHQVLEFHKARQKLRQKDKNLQDILRNMSIGILVVNRAGTILYANPAGLEMFGNPAKGLEGKPFGYPITPGVSVDIDLPLRPGGPGVAEMGATQGIWEDKECYIVMLRDITERKKAEEALTKAKEHLEHVLSVIPVIVYTLDPESLAPTWVSPNIAAMLGYSPEEVLESGSGWWRDHLHPEDKDKAQALKEEIFAKGHHFHEYRFRKKDGEYLWLRDEFRVVNDAQGKPVEIVGAWNDVTRERQMEEEQRKLEEQLHQAQRLESVGRMAGGVAHDFNNMLNVILGYADLIHQKLHPGDPLRENVEQILRAAQRSADLTRQLLAFSRKQTLQPEVLDLNNVVRNIEKMLHRLIGEDIALELALSGDLSPVK
ncbi:MAG: PAS domain S-box protein, partial [Deltaproteobacteria bacterium]|nr:PAS domain S-box protein [Deltaproteobacteria bacterium]